MNRFIKATYHVKQKAAEFVTDDGRHLIRTGGSLQWRICNGGDLSSPVTNGQPTPKKTKNYIGFANPADSDHFFFIFPDYETGREQLKISLRRKHNDKSLRQMVEAYAPPSDRNNTEKYASDLSKLSGVAKTTVMKDLSDAQLGSVMDGIERLEGYHSDAESRKETWVTVSHINATDGTRPVAGEEIVVRKDDKEVVLKSDAVGRFPPIVHGKGNTEVHHKATDGTLKKVGDLPEEEGKHLSLLNRVAQYFGTTAPVTPPSNPTAKKQPFAYEVQPKDNLGKIAVLFGTTVSDIKRDNHLVKDIIFPGQRLGIHGPLSGKLSATGPKQALPKPDTPPETAPAPPRPAEPKKSSQPKPREVPAAALSLETQTKPARSKTGSGEALALFYPDPGVAPWMKFALDEAKHFEGAVEQVIEKTRNYHKEIHDGLQTIVGDKNPWCAAFVNWCLMTAGYPIENPKESGFVDRVAAKARANGFMKLRGAKADKKQKYDDVPLVVNPLYRKIEEPVYGAIAVVTNASGIGHHTGFVYGRIDDNHVCILGGNQSQMINFASTNIRKIPASTTVVDGKKVKIKGSNDVLNFFLPISYDIRDKAKMLPLVDCNAEKLNAAIGIKKEKKLTGGIL